MHKVTDLKMIRIFSKCWPSLKIIVLQRVKIGYTIFTRSQTSGESYDKYIGELVVLVKDSWGTWRIHCWQGAYAQHQATPPQYQDNNPGRGRGQNRGCRRGDGGQIPDGPRVKVALEVFEYQGIHYLLMLGYYSKFPEVYCSKNETKARDFMKAHKSIFAHHGICQTLLADNVPWYMAEEFKKFAKDWEFTYVTSSPRYSRSNGQAERMIQTEEPDK